MLDYSEHYETLWGPVIDVGTGQMCVYGRSDDSQTNERGVFPRCKLCNSEVFLRVIKVKKE